MAVGWANNEDEYINSQGVTTWDKKPEQVFYILPIPSENSIRFVRKLIKEKG